MAAKRQPTQKFVRNIYERHSSVRLRNGKRIDLAPRGQRGDTMPIHKDDVEDDLFLANKDLLFEVITAKEAEKVVSKQSTNMQRDRHPALDTIRNELGEAYDDDSINTDMPEPEESVVVAQTKSVAEGVGDVIIDRGVGIRRAALPGTVDRSSPNIPDSVSPEEQAEYLAGRAELESALGGKEVVLGETEKESGTKE